MLYADFEVSINTSELEEALNGSLSKLGYKVISVKDRYLYKEYRDNNFVPVKKGIEYEVKKGLLGRKTYIGLDFHRDSDSAKKTGEFLISSDLTDSLYSFNFSLNKDESEKDLLNIIKTTMSAIPYCPKTSIRSYGQ